MLNNNTSPGRRIGRILVVDDEYLNLRIVESYLSDTYHLTTALSGAEALDKLSHEKPDLIILDVMMPVMTGHQVCQIIRKHHDPDELPIVILVAKDRGEDLVKGLSLGANDYIAKPFSKEELWVRIDQQFKLMHLQQVAREQLRYDEYEKQLCERELQYREAVVKVMQDCHYYWQKVTGESIIDLAEKSRLWTASIDNGRLRTRSMDRYLSLDKLPSNPRWRQVARTAYFVLSKVSADDEARSTLQSSVARLQEIVEQKALT